MLTLVSGDTVFSIRIARPESSFKPIIDRTYHWFDQGQLGYAQGGYTGQLLQGETTAKRKNGDLVRKGSYKNGLKDGTWIEWHGNGKLRSNYIWKDGWRHGEFFLYDEMGMVRREGKYRNNVLHGKVRDYRQGQLVIESKYKNGNIVIDQPKIPNKPRKKKAADSLRTTLTRVAVKHKKTDFAQELWLACSADFSTVWHLDVFQASILDRKRKGAFGRKTIL